MLVSILNWLTYGDAIIGFGRNETNELIGIRVTNFRSFLIFSLPLRVGNIEQEIIKADNLTTTLFPTIQNILKVNYNIDSELIKGKTLYYAQEHNRAFIKVYTSDKRFKELRLQGIELENLSGLYIDSHDQFMASKGLSHSSTVLIENYTEVLNKILKVDKEIIVDVNSISLSSTPIEPNWCAMSFDIEVYSSNPNGCFMNPKNTKPEEEIFNISMVIKHNENISLNVLITSIPNSKNINNGVLVQCNNEVEVLNTFFRAIDTYNPDFIFAQNGNRFDLEYINSRMKIYNLNMNNTSRIMY